MENNSTKTIICSNCNKENPIDVGRCSFCKTKLHPNICEKCEKPVGYGENLCSSCLKEITEKLELGTSCEVCGLRNPIGRQVCAGCGIILKKDNINAIEILLQPTHKIINDQLLFIIKESWGEGINKYISLIGDQGMGKSTILREFHKSVTSLFPDNNVLYISETSINDNLAPPLGTILLKHLMVYNKKDFESWNDFENTMEIIYNINNIDKSYHDDYNFIVGSLIGMSPDNESKIPLFSKDPELFLEKLNNILIKFLSILISKNYTGWIIDSIRDIPKESFLIINNLLSHLNNLPFWVIISGNPLLISQYPIEFNESITIPQLKDDEMVEIIKKELELKELPHEFNALMLSRANGNPGSLKELIRLLIDSGVINKESKPYKIDSTKLSSIVIPFSLEEALNSRWNALDKKEKDYLIFGSVMGEIFWDEAVLSLNRAEYLPTASTDPSQIWPDDSETINLESVLTKLEEKDFIVRHKHSNFQMTGEYKFVYPNLCQKIYSEMPSDKRRRYHLLVAQWLESKVKNENLRFWEMIAYNWERGMERRKAANAYIKAGQIAKNRFIHNKAVLLYEKGVACMDEDNRDIRIEALHDLGTIYEITGNYDLAIEKLTDMLKDAWALVYRGKAGAALNKIGRIYRARGDYAASKAYLERSLQLFEAANDNKGIASCLDDLGTLFWLRGQYNRALNLHLKSLSIRRSFGDSRSISVSLQNIGNVKRHQGKLKESISYFLEALQLCDQVNDSYGKAYALNRIGVSQYEMGEYSKAKELWMKSLELTEKIGDKRLRSFLLNNIGEVLREEEYFTEAEEYFQEALNLATDLNDKRTICEVFRNIGVLYIAKREESLAKEYLEKALKISIELDSKEAQGLIRKALAVKDTNFATNINEAKEQIIKNFDTSRQLFETLGNILELAKTDYEYGKFLIKIDDIEKGKAILNKAYVIYKKINSSLYLKVEEEFKKLGLKPDENLKDEIVDLTDEVDG